MQKKKKSVLLWLIVAVFMVAGLIFPGLSGAGNLEPPLEAVDINGDPKSTMVTVGEIYYKLELMHEDIGSGSCEGARVEKTGQTMSYGTADDGDLETGVEWPNPRFTDNGDGTVTDNLTGLIWLKNADCFGLRTWSTALTDSNTLNNSECGLSDGSAQGDWRLPSVKELQSLIDFGNYDPALPAGHPFSGVQLSYYWSSTTSAVYADSPWSSAWSVSLSYGSVYDYSKTGIGYVWPVRGGE